VAVSAVVLAAGAWSGALAATAGVQLPIEPVPRVVVTTGVFPGVPERRTLVIDATSSFYFHREGDGVLMGMGGRDATTFDTTVDDRFVNEELVPRAVTVYPPLADAGIHSRWAGLYEMTPDRLPVVGPAPVDGLWVAAGFSGHGFQHGPIVGKVVAESIMGAPASVDVSALSLNRFGAGDLTSERHVV
jgi:sarcosine oxidase subunit beta